jgi:hypothetical protein
MKRTKRAYDPARPDCRHFEKQDDEFEPKLGESIVKFLGNFTEMRRQARIRIKLVSLHGQESFDLLQLQDNVAFFDILETSNFSMQDVFFQPLAYDPSRHSGMTWFGWADTGTLHPSVFNPKPIAYWETSPKQFQAVCKWKHGIPILASTARVEALLHEYGGKVGSHLPDAYMRVPGLPNFSRPHDRWPIVRLRFDAFPLEDVRKVRQANSDTLYLSE